MAENKSDMEKFQGTITNGDRKCGDEDFKTKTVQAKDMQKDTGMSPKQKD